MHRIASLIFAASAFWTSAIAVAQVQPGSTGETVGKQDKSISGGNTPEESRPSTRKQEPHPSVAKGSSCARIAGTWKWSIGTTVISSNGSARHSDGATGPWTCSESQMVIVWSNGYTDHLTLSSDGNQLDAVNNLGIHFSPTRF
jgi:hypothetical protein